MSTNSSGSLYILLHFSAIYMSWCCTPVALCKSRYSALQCCLSLKKKKRKKRKKQNELSHCMFTSLHQQFLTISRTEVNVLSWYAFACDRNSHHNENKPQHQQQNIYSHTGNTSWQAVVSVVGDTASHYAFAFVVHTLVRMLICDDVIILSVLK